MADQFQYLRCHYGIIDVSNNNKSLSRSKNLIRHVAVKLYGNIDERRLQPIEPTK